MQKLRDKIKNEPMYFLMKKVWVFSYGYRVLFSVAILLKFIASLTLLVEPWLFARLIKEIETFGTTRMLEIYKILGLFALLNIIFYLLHGPARYIMGKITFYTELAYSRYLLSGVFNLPLSWHGDKDSGDTIDKINKARSALKMSTYAIIDYVQTGVKLFGTSIVLLWFDVRIAVFAFIVSVFAMAHLLYFNKHIIPLTKKINQYNNKASAGIFDSI